jgi:alkylation response protein AidB-like acyl-CoA dehydrogenase
MAIDFELGESLDAVRLRTRECLAPLAARRREIQRRSPQEGGYPDDVWQALADAGILGGVIPRAYGGTEIGALGVTVGLEELAALDVGNFLPVLTTMAAFAIVQRGSEELKQRVLPEIAAGRWRSCFALTEREAGFNVFRIQTSAQRVGDDYLLDGEKILISAADVVDYLLVTVRTKSAEDCVREGMGKAYGMSMLLVDAKSAGLSREQQDTGTAGGILRQYRLRFDAVRVPSANLIGVEHGGALGMLTCFTLERVLTAALAVGASRYCLDIACEHARTRKVFGDTPIGRYQAIQHPLAEVRLRQEAVRLLVQKAAWGLDRGDDPRLVGVSANAAKFLGVELGLKSVDSAVEALGGRGFEEESGLMRLWQAARLMRTSPISDSLILNFVAEHDLALPRAS